MTAVAPAPSARARGRVAAALPFVPAFVVVATWIVWAPDGGGYRGVALWADGDEVVVVSQLEAGPFRYVNEWRLGADGTIRPRLGKKTPRS